MLESKSITDHSLFDDFPTTSTTTTTIKDHITYTELVRNNTRIIDNSNKWNILLIRESLNINQRKPSMIQCLQVLRIRTNLAPK